jgi:hypothetical protein
MFLPIAPDVRARGVLAHRQFFARLRMKIFTKVDELVHPGDAS